jgi:F-box and WD-40 domain protein 1/11
MIAALLASTLRFVSSGLDMWPILISACTRIQGDMIISGSNDRKIKVWSASTGECLQTLSGHDLLVRALAFNPLLGKLVSASYDKTVKVWDLKTGTCVREFKDFHSSHIFDVKFDATRIIRYVQLPPR